MSKIVSKSASTSTSKNASRAAVLSEQNVIILPLAALLQRLESSDVAVDAGQYRTVALRLANVLAQAKMDDTLQAILQAHPAASELYENVNYVHAGLCRSALDAGLSAEHSAKQLLARAAG